jgi:hypothetical protein
MDWLAAPEYWVARWLLERLLAVAYFVAFVSTALQFRALLGERGLVPVRSLLRAVPFRRAPSLFHIHYSDRFAAVLTWTGASLAASLILGLPQHGPLWITMTVWFALWVLYLSFVNVGSPYYGFVWETLLLEAGLLAIFLGDDRTAPPLLVFFLFRWLLFRLEVGAGLIKVRNDPAWRDLTALNYHHETQPIPGPFSWHIHRLPGAFHKLEVLGNHFAQLVAPFLLFAPQPFAVVAGGVIIVTQVWLLLSGNFAWLNVLTIALAMSALPNDVLTPLLPLSPPAVHDAPLWFEGLVIALTTVVVVLSYWPLRNMASRRQIMNASFNPLHFVNTYGLFGHITRERFEVVIEGTDAASLGPATEWKEYEFRAKPGNPSRRPRQVAPYHLRLDWMMWFAALSPAYAEGWFVPFLAKILSNDAATLRLLRTNPFEQRRPTFVRALRYRYRFTTRDERHRTGAWWHREPVGVYMLPMYVGNLEPSAQNGELAT